MSDLKVRISSWGTVMLDKRELKALMRGAANDVRNKTARMIGQTSGAGRSYSGGGGSAYRGAYSAKPYTASAPGAPPVRVTSTLRKSLRAYAYKSGEGFAVRAKIFYALWLETGAVGGGNPHGRAPVNKRTGYSKRAKGRYTTRVLEPRPFLDRVLAQEAANINRRVQQAMTAGLTWKATK